jgi:excisionase family DNA binding protein
MYSTAEVATILEVEERTVRYYIQQGYLKASRDGKNYQINNNDLSSFLKGYFHNERKTNPVLHKTFDKQAFKKFEELISSAKDGMSLEELIEKYQKIEFKVPSYENYMRYERNKEIFRDKLRGLSIKKIAEKYNLCRASVENILKNRGDEEK